MGTLVAYTALGATKVTFALPTRGGEGSSDKKSDAQALVVRRFDIPSGSLEDVLRPYEQITGIHVALADEGMKTVASPGVTGLYTPEQALGAMLSSTGLSYRFVSLSEVRIELEKVTSSVEVTAE